MDELTCEEELPHINGNVSYKRKCGNTIWDINTPKAVSYHEPTVMWGQRYRACRAEADLGEAVSQFGHPFQYFTVYVWKSSHVKRNYPISTEMWGYNSG